MQFVFGSSKSIGNLDYVSCWFLKGARYIQNSNSELALVSTNSVCQGEQVAILWPQIFNLDINIHFAYTTFAWTNNARDKAAVHVVIIGLTCKNKIRRIFNQSADGLHHHLVENISPYLVEGNNTAVLGRKEPLIENVPLLVYGNKPTDGGHLFLTADERSELIKYEPQAERWIRKIVGANEFINSIDRWVLWLVDATDSDLESMPLVQKRISAVYNFRIKSPKSSTKKKANYSHIFDEVRQPTSGNYILVPRHSSERRVYIPMGFLSSNVICSDANLFIPNGTLYEFGILSSLLHNDWMRLVAGRLKSDYRYAASVVYNPFPWPDVTQAQSKEIERLAEEVILTREEFPGRTLAELYDPEKMPSDLLIAHQRLDKAVDSLYRERPFKDAADRLSYLLARYEKLVKK
jgi:hypothetical protein